MVSQERGDLEPVDALGCIRHIRFVEKGRGGNGARATAGKWKRPLLENRYPAARLAVTTYPVCVSLRFICARLFQCRGQLTLPNDRVHPTRNCDRVRFRHSAALRLHCADTDSIMDRTFETSSPGHSP